MDDPFRSDESKAFSKWVAAIIVLKYLKSSECLVLFSVDFSKSFTIVIEGKQWS